MTDISAEEKKFYDGFTAKIENEIKSSPLKLIPAAKFTSTESYTKEDSRGKYAESTYYFPKPYAFPNLTAIYMGKKNKHKSGTEVAIRLSDAIGVDAVASFDLNIVQIKPKSAIGSKSMGLMGTFVIKNKDGKTVFNRTIQVKSKSKLGFNLSDKVVFNEKTRKQLSQMEQEFFIKINNMMTKALKKK